jgi:Outer membrane protein beta-barrel domain
MKLNLVCLTSIASLFAVVITAGQAQAQVGSSSVGGEIMIQNNTSFGINGKFGVSDNISIRPRLIFSAEKRDTVTNIGISGTQYGVAATYDFKPNTGGGNSPTIFVGPEIAFWNGSGRVNGVDVTGNTTIINAIAGVEYPVTEAIDVTGKLILPLSNNGSASGGGISRNIDFDKNFGFTFGASYRF